MVTVSVILPVCNESACIGQSLAAILAFAKQYPRYQFIFVDDGSIDDTAALVSEQLAQQESDQFWLISYSINRGKGYAVKQGVEFADGDYICFMDGDLAYSLDHIEQMEKLLQSYDIVIGCRDLVPESRAQPSWLRKLTGRVFNWISRAVLQLPYRDMQAGLKGFRKPVAKDLFRRQRITGFAFDVELLYMAKQLGYQIAELPARLSPSHRHKLSKISLGKDSFLMALDLLSIRFQSNITAYEKRSLAQLRHRRVRYHDRIWTTDSRDRDI
jgi:glycosyltransferase involved in cell wall biosynthesis